MISKYDQIVDEVKSIKVKITQKLIIPNNEIQWRFSRSSEAGGQNVKKIESQVELIFDIHKSKALNTIQKNMILKS